MKIGFIGLGKMGGNMVTRLINNNHEVVALDPNKNAVDAVVKNGAIGATSREDLVAKLSPVIIWLMIPSQFVDDELKALLEILQPGSIVIDGGNSDYRLTQERAILCKEKSIFFVDVGTSGGILGLENGYSMMAGGDDEAIKAISPALDTLAPPNGWHHFGKTGNGHYVKMVHNAIEYGIMESYAEGYRMLHDGPVKNLDLAAAANVWQQGSIIESLLNGLNAEILNEDSELNGVDGFVKESGETRWTLDTAKENGIDLPAIQTAFNVRLESQNGNINYATKMLAAMRNKFGGHAINKEEK